MKIELFDDGDDRLRVVATDTITTTTEDAEGEPRTEETTTTFVAFGHVSWTKQYWKPGKGQLKKGQLHDGSDVREMTKGELEDYAHQLLDEQAPGWRARPKGGPKSMGSFEV